MTLKARLLAIIICVFAALPSFAQQDPLNFATVERPPFATQMDGTPSGFSLELMRMIGAKLDREVTFQFYDSFADMLSAVQDGQHDGAVANISITAERERMFDFTQPIFESGIGVLLAEGDDKLHILQALFTREILFAIIVALGLLFGSGMLMWVFERRAQPYFDRPAGDAMFPSFWWALNLVVNGGFEERMPRSRFGRMFAVVLVVTSLFAVSIFVATITAALTVDALQDDVGSINDLEGQRVATVSGSTSAAFLDSRELGYSGYNSPADIFERLENGQVDAVVFDAPILSYYSYTTKDVETRLLPRIYRPENYGIVLPAGSQLAEPIDQTLLRLREDGTYAELVSSWFGQLD